jgi:hypothetical protein
MSNDRGVIEYRCVDLFGEGGVLEAPFRDEQL